jgi:hypothetical protein
MKHMVEFFIPGALFSEGEVHEVPERTVEAAIKLAPRHAFAFRFYDVNEPPADIDRESFDVAPKALNKSARYYLGGELFTPDEIVAGAAGTGDFSILVSNARGNGYDRLIRCRTGNWQPFEADDTLVIEGEER